MTTKQKNVIEYTGDGKKSRVIKVCSGCVDAMMFLSLDEEVTPRALHCGHPSVLTKEAGSEYLTRARLIRVANHDGTVSWKAPDWCPK